MVDWKNKNVFITGADGFVGGWLAKVLVEKGAHVVAICRDEKKGSALDLHNIRNKVTVVRGDVINYSLIKRIINEYDIHYCFHLAAQAIVSLANRSPLSTFETNIKGTWTILEAIRNSGNDNFKGIIIASTDKAYGTHEKLPYTEESELRGIYPYDASKVCADIIARCYAKTYGLNVGVTRKGNIYGGGDLNFSRIVPRAISWIRGEADLVLRGNGVTERDYLYIEDAIEGYLMLADNLSNDEVRGEAFNFSSNQPISVKDLVGKIIQISGKDVTPKIEPGVFGEIDRQYLSNEKALRVLGWKPRHNLQEGLMKSWEWYNRYLESQK